MSNTLRAGDRPRVIFMGMTGNFSLPPLRALLESGIEICAVVLPAQVRDATQPAIRRLELPIRARAVLPVLSSALHASIARIAWEGGIPLWEVQRMSDAETRAVYSSYEPDALCVACFSLYIPRSILDIPRLGCLNVHPSLLPANRGPDPLFWTFREGSGKTGVSIHLVDEGLDTGPIVAQEQIDVPDGIRYAELETRCAELGGKLLVRSLRELHRGTAHLMQQDEAKSSYLPVPTAEDYVVPAAEWTARRVYNFVRGVALPGQPVQLVVNGGFVKAVDAISYSHEDIDTGASLAHEGTAGEVMRVRCMDGWVVLTVQ